MYSVRHDLSQRFTLKFVAYLYSHLNFRVSSKSLHNINSWTIQLGITRRNSHTYYGQKVKVQRVLPHPHYNFEVMHDNDIALFQVNIISSDICYILAAQFINFIH